MAKLYVVRHANTALNTQSRIRGWSNPPLDATGKQDAHKLATKLLAEKCNVDVLACSDLDRAVQTAKVIGEALGVKQLLMDWHFRPWDVGELTGSDSNAATKTLDTYIRDPKKKVPDGESFSQFDTRFMTALEGILSRNEGRDVMIVVHHRGERLIEYHLTGNPREMDKIGIDPATYNEYSHKGGKINK